MIEVGDMPTPHVEEPERFPGGPDALDDQSRYGEIPDGPMGADLPPDQNPATARADDGCPRSPSPTTSRRSRTSRTSRRRSPRSPQTPV